MVSFAEALGLLLSRVPPAETERCRIELAAGRVLRQPVVADRALPPFNRVMMDGYALRRADWDAGIRTFRVAGTAPAGTPEDKLPEGPGMCLEIMTGAPFPQGADCVVPVEDVVRRGDGEVTLAESSDPLPGRYVHLAGSDVSSGERLLEPGCVLGSREVGVTASCGGGWLEVSALPAIAVIATGDELVAVDEAPRPHQIRQSNAHALAAALERAGFPVSHSHSVADDPETAEPVLREALARHGWVVLTGAVSKGARDFVPELLGRLGCTKLFHGVAQRPGKPAGCWIGPSEQLVLALPGNPVSALTGLHAFVLPALAASLGTPFRQPRHGLADPSAGLPDFTWHLPVKLRDDGLAEPAPTGNSGDFVGLLRSEGFLTLPPLAEREPGATFPFTAWK